MSNLILTNGCFDVLTVGHFNILSYCRMLAGSNGTVIVALDSDDKIKKDKGKDRPIYTINDRTNHLLDLIDSSGSHIVNFIEPFDSNEELLNIVKKYRPDVLVKGSDWKNNIVGEEIAKQTILYPRLSSYSSTKTIEKILLNFFEEMQDFYSYQELSKENL